MWSKIHYKYNKIRTHISNSSRIGATIGTGIGGCYGVWNGYNTGIELNKKHGKLETHDKVFLLACNIAINAFISGIKGWVCGAFWPVYLIIIVDDKLNQKQ